jgi:hypothetical protein
MLSLQKVLQYLAQLAGGVVGQENVVALILAVDKNTPIILYANNEDVDLTFKVGSDVVVEASSKTTQDLRIAFEHDREINSQLNPSEIASQSQAQLKKIVAGQLQLSENAAMAVTALVAGRVYKVSQPTDHRYGGYVGYGFIHAEMVLLDYVFSAKLAPPTKNRYSLGISKRLCGCCAIAMQEFERAYEVNLILPDAHWLAYKYWRVPPILLQNAQGIVKQLNTKSQRGKVFSLTDRNDVCFVFNDGTIGHNKLDMQVITNGFSEQYGSMSPFREDTFDEEEIIWLCVNSKCEMNYGRQVTPVLSGGFRDEYVCPFCCKAVITLKEYMKEDNMNL